MSASDGSTAANILTAALGHMRDRAATYDKPEGERSMGATVDAFHAVTGVSMTEEQGWLFMALLKAVRSQHGAYRADSYEDGAAYFALAGEAAVRDRTVKESLTVHPVHPATFDHIDPADVEIASAIEDDSERMQAIGQNGEMASEVYAAVDAMPKWQGVPEWAGAPEWAEWLAMDSNGEWYWYERQIRTSKLRGTWEYGSGMSGAIQSAAYSSDDDRPDWRSSLQPRHVK